MICKFCNKICKNDNSLHQHEIRCYDNPNKIKTKHSLETIRKISEKMKLANSNSTRVWKKESREKIGKFSKEFNSTYWTEEKRKEHSNLMKKVVQENPESYSTSNVSGRAKIYTHRGIKLKGTWEVRIAEMLDENEIKWTNEIIPIPYFWNNSWHLYFPDFYLIDMDKYIEVKGYQRDRDESKWSYVKKPLIIIKNSDIKSLIKKKKNIIDYLK